mgnify:CR=1 FL=1
MKTILRENKHTESPVLPDMMSEMKVSLVVTEDSGVCIFHDKPFKPWLEWVEYDVDTGMVTCILKEGKLKNVGIKIHPDMHDYLKDADTVYALYIPDEEIQDIYEVELIVRETGI